MDDFSTSMTPLDQMVSQDHLQILKAAIPYLPKNNQKFFSIYAKLMELSHTVSFFQQPQPELSKMDMSVTAAQPVDILQEFRKYTTGPAKDRIDQLLFALNTIQLIQMYQEFPMAQEENNESESMDE